MRILYLVLLAILFKYSTSIVSFSDIFIYSYDILIFLLELRFPTMWDTMCALRENCTVRFKTIWVVYFIPTELFRYHTFVKLDAIKVTPCNLRTVKCCIGKCPHGTRTITRKKGVINLPGRKRRRECGGISRQKARK